MPSKKHVLKIYLSPQEFRDTGKEVFYSIHDTKAEHTARLYAKKKWGKRLVVDKGHIMFHAERENERTAPEYCV